MFSQDDLKVLARDKLFSQKIDFFQTILIPYFNFNF
jgi:hypothetical protein